MKTRNVEILRARLIDWYLQNQRKLPWRDTQDPYAIWVSEVMLQQTQVKTVVPYYLKFLERFPDVEHLARSNLQEVLKSWEGLGYYARARNLHRAAKTVVQEYGGSIPANLKDFRKLPGVGAYIGAAVQSIAFQQPNPVVDGNVKRVLSRLYRIDAPVNHTSSQKIFQRLSARLLDRLDPGVFNQAVMELGAAVCKPQQPACGGCPWSSACRAQKSGAVNAYPKRIQRKKIPEHYIAVGVIYRETQVLITRRKTEGLLGGLWEFPGGKVRDAENGEAACIREIKEEVNLSVAVVEHLARIRHAYTHFKIVMDVFRCRHLSGEVKLNGPADYRWISVPEIKKYPFPAANHKFIPLLK
jgi:A/G-specific adenine glycosylase